MLFAIFLQHGLGDHQSPLNPGLLQQPPPKRVKVYPPDRTMIYVRQATEEICTALHLVSSILNLFLILGLG